MLRTEIDKDEPLFPGDEIEMHFKAFGPAWVYLRASELAILKWQLSEKHPDYRLMAWQDVGDELILTFRILEPAVSEPQVYQAGIITTAAVIGAVVIGAGLFAWLSLDKIYKITDSPAGKLALAGTGSLGVAALVVAVLLLLRHYSE
ncbi:hypothetical protein LCGC14_0840760 [marine sediment metagenome]|uniref:Uncharacterized protein n=1 Tax=marine sediment metagenome TaxID=412755 RepID=A0A0F9SKN4_9ZZZZ